jgi:DNA-binding beta-propeller fold protein YncE
MKSIYLAALSAMLIVWATTSAAEMDLVQTIQLKGKAGNLDHLTLDAKRDRLLVANKTNNTLDVVDLKLGTLLKQIANQTSIQGIAYAGDVDRVFVGLGTNGLCNVFDGETYKAVKTIKFADDCDNVRYNPKTQLVYVAHAEKSLGVINAKTNALKADIKLPAAAEAFILEVGRPRAYVAAPSPCQIVVIDTDKNEVATTYPVKAAGDAHPIALDETAHRIYLGCRKEPKVVILDTESGKEVGETAIPNDVDDLFLDTKRKRIYASCGEGFIAVLKVTDADHVELLEKIPTAKGARTCFYVADTGKLYLAVPRQEGKEGPEIRVYQAK